MDDARRTKISKYLSKHLRHTPERIGLVLGSGGWIAIDALLAACAQRGFALTREELELVVAKSEKQRFGIDPTRTLIRASQGHSVEVDLALPAAVPPAVLFHGTAEANAASIEEAGLRKMGRHHVHLSLDRETAITVGRRHGKPIVFAVDAAAMHREGFTFHRADNGVWLVDEVPARYLSRSALTRT